MLAFHLSRVPVCGVWVTTTERSSLTKKLFNAGLDGNTWRANDFREGDTIDKTPLKALLREAVAYNTTLADRLGPWICLRDM